MTYLGSDTVRCVVSRGRHDAGTDWAEFRAVRMQRWRRDGQRHLQLHRAYRGPLDHGRCYLCVDSYCSRAQLVWH